ncbi:MAG TPA: hypothetical protein VF037_07670 [Gemmatimonadales bacterium]
MRMIGRVRSWLAVLAIAVAAAACSDSNEPGDTTLTIQNDSGVDIAIVNFSNCDDPEWGEDRLDDDEFIEAGEDRTFDIEDGCWDIRVIFVGGAAQTDLGNEIAEGEDFTWVVD